MTVEAALLVVFILFGVETVFGRFVPWALNLWRDFMELRESLYEDEESPA